MHQNQAEDWIEYIIDKVYTNYRGRQIVLWGKYALYGKSNKYYIVVPLAYYQSIKEKLIRGGV